MIEPSREREGWTFTFFNKRNEYKWLIIEIKQIESKKYYHYRKYLDHDFHFVSISLSKDFPRDFQPRRQVLWNTMFFTFNLYVVVPETNTKKC